jgi:hypothetical protein
VSNSPARHLSDAAEAVRAFNHETIGTGKDWQYPPNTYTALGSLSRLVGMLEQAIQQSTRPVTRTHDDNRVLIDGGGDPHTAVVELLAAQADAQEAAAALTAAVQRMHNANSPMGLDTRGLPEFEDDGDDE